MGEVMSGVLGAGVIFGGIYVVMTAREKLRDKADEARARRLRE